MESKLECKFDIKNMGKDKVDCTAARNANLQLQAADATAYTNGCSEMLSVLSPRNLTVVRFLTVVDPPAARKRSSKHICGRFLRRTTTPLA